MLISAPWPSWLRRLTVIIWQSEDREFEPLWGRLFLVEYFFPPFQILVARNSGVDALNFCLGMNGEKKSDGWVF